MLQDRIFNELNRASTSRIRALAAGLSDRDLLLPVGSDWTVAIALAHIAFWDRRVLFMLEMTEREGKPFVPRIDVIVNDLSLPFWAAIPPRAAAQLAVSTAVRLDDRLENFSPALLEELYTENQRWVMRSLHRAEHLDEIDAALKSAGLSG